MLLRWSKTLKGNVEKLHPQKRSDSISVLCCDTLLVTVQSHRETEAELSTVKISRNKSLFDKSNVCPRANKALAPISRSAKKCVCCLPLTVMVPQIQESCRLGTIGKQQYGRGWLQTYVSLHSGVKQRGPSVNTSWLGNTPPCLLGLTPTDWTSTPKQGKKPNKLSHSGASTLYPFPG